MYREIRWKDRYVNDELKKMSGILIMLGIKGSLFSVLTGTFRGRIDVNVKGRNSYEFICYW